MRTPRFALFFCSFVAACGGDAFTAQSLVPELDAAAADAPPPTADAGQEASAADATNSDGLPDDALRPRGDAPPDAPKTGEDAPALPDAPHVDAGAGDASPPDVASPPADVAPPPEGDAAGDAPVCDLRPCMCGGPYVAMCCNGPCPSGFEGLSCYCGQCPFPKTVSDAGRCE